jgi:hypothetical protein
MFHIDKMDQLHPRVHAHTKNHFLNGQFFLINALNEFCHKSEALICGI